MIDKSHMTIDLLEKNTQLKPTMVFDPDNIVDPNLAELSVEPSEIKLVENGEGTTALSLSFKFNGYDDVLSATVPVTVDLPEENKLLAIKTNNLHSLNPELDDESDINLELCQSIPNCIKIFQPDINNQTAVHNYQSYDDVDTPIEFPINYKNDSETEYLIFCKGESVDLSDINITGTKYELAEVIFSDNVVINTINFEDGIFSNCTNLSNVVLPNKLLDITENMFLNCLALSSITIPDEVSAISEVAFNTCTKLSNITVSNKNSTFASENGLLYSKDKTKLLKCPINLSTVNIASEITTICPSAFYQSTANNIDLANLTVLTTVEPESFYNCLNIKTLTIPSAVTSIGSNFFRINNEDTYSDQNVISVDIKCNLSVLTNTAFTYNMYLILSSSNNYIIQPNKFENYIIAGLNLSNATLSSGCFKNTTLNSITINNPINIEKNSFSKCYITEDLVLSTSSSSKYKLLLDDLITTDELSVTRKTLIETLSAEKKRIITCFDKISENLIIDTTDLSGDETENVSRDINPQTYFDIDETITEIDLGAFDNITTLEKFVINNNTIFHSTNKGLLLDTNDNIIAVPKSISELDLSEVSALSVLNDSMFFNDLIKITDLTIPSNITEIGENTFKGCIELSSIKIENSNIVIGANAFANCYSVSDLSIGEKTINEIQQMENYPWGLSFNNT